MACAVASPDPQRCTSPFPGRAPRWKSSKMKGKCSLSMPTLIFEENSYRASVLRKVDTYLRIGGGILDGVVQKNQKQLMQRGLIADIGNLLVQVAHDGNIPRAGARGNQCASLFQDFIDIDGFTFKVQLPSVGDREREQPLYDAGQFLQFIVDGSQRLSVFFCGARFGKNQFRFPMKHGERSTQFVRSR